MAIRTIPAGYSGPHVLADYMFSRPCKACGGQGEERYFDGEVMRSYREDIWGPGTLRRMAQEIGIPPSSLSAMERGIQDWTEDRARRYLTALGIL